MTDLYTEFKSVLRDVVDFCETTSKIKLRSYQVEVATSIVDSVIYQKGKTFVVIFPRQSGKNELQAQIETYLLVMNFMKDCEMVKASPTYKPQTMNAMRRLERVLSRNNITWKMWKKESGYIYRIGNARIYFLSGSPEANVVGATANTLLQCDEAQDVMISKWDKDFAPMAASTNATRVFWGTMWTSKTLLAREMRAALEEEKRDGVKRVFIMTADEVAKEVKAYGQFVKEQVAKLGRNHPLIKTQYYSEEIDAESGMFPARRRALMQGTHEKLEEPRENEIYAMMLDVAGEDEGAGVEIAMMESELKNPGRDSTALTVARIDLSTVGDPLIKAPRYEVVNRYLWTGVKHTLLYGQIKALMEHWRARWLVVDATGVGAGLYSFLDSAAPGKILPYVFTQKSKSDLAWGFLACVETGRYKEYRPADELQSEFWKQADYCQARVMDGPGQVMRWGVPDGTRDAETGELVHDDLLISAALSWVLDGQDWGMAMSGIVAEVDPISKLGRTF